MSIANCWYWQIGAIASAFAPCVVCVIGFLLSFLLPEPNQKSLEAIVQEGETTFEGKKPLDDTMEKSYAGSGSRRQSM